jgi:hypothetical protein
MARAIYDTNYIEIIKGAIAIGVPVGYKMLKNLILCSEKPISITDTIVDTLSIKVSVESDVTVSTTGIIPQTLAKKIELWKFEIVES